MKNKKIRLKTTVSDGSVVDDTGLEPVTSRTSSGCSYQLS